jgi:hypothetical protein
MYQRLMFAIKRRILDETRDAFKEHPAFSEKVQIFNKFPYKERIQYGVILRNTSSSQIRLSPDNFMSDLYSLVRLAKQGTNPGLAIEWVRENAGNITEIAVEDVSNQLGPTQRRFYTADPILAGKDNTEYADNPGQVRVTIDGVKIIPESVSGEDREVLLYRATNTGQVVEINYYHRNIILPSINIIEFPTDESFTVGTIYVIEEEVLVSRTTGTETTVTLGHGGGNNVIDTGSDDLYIACVDGIRLYTLKRNEDYSINYLTGVVTFLQPLEKNYRIYVNYRYQVDGAIGGPYSFEAFQENSEAIPGVVISIGRRAKAGDKQAIMVSKFREQQAKIYGGHWEMSLDLAVVSKDPTQMEQMTDQIISYLWGKRKNVLEYEGIALNSVEPTGETEEVHIETTGDLYYESSVSINLQSEWQRFVPYNPIYALRGIYVIADTRHVLKSPVLGFEKLT